MAHAFRGNDDDRRALAVYLSKLGRENVVPWWKRALPYAGMALAVAAAGGFFVGAARPPAGRGDPRRRPGPVSRRAEPPDGGRAAPRCRRGRAGQAGDADRPAPPHRHRGGLRKEHARHDRPARTGR